MRTRSIFGASALVAAATALLPIAGAAQVAARETEHSEPAPLTVHVENHNWLDMHVYASRSGGPLRSLGMVTSMSSGTFRLPADLAMAGTDLRMVVDPIGGSGIYVSQPLLVNPGGEILVTVQNTLELSYTTLADHPAG